jgi:hypothetical protein
VRLKLIVFSALALSSSMANAGFLSLDWKASGDALATLHEESGTEWLKLSETDGMSISEVASEMSEGGDFEGWRFPSVNEVFVVNQEIYGMIDKFTYEDPYRAYYGSESRDESLSLLSDFESVFGLTSDSYLGDGSSGYTSYGVFLNDELDPSLGSVLLSGIYLNTSESSNEDYLYYYSNWSSSNHYNVDYKSSRVAVYLVSDGGATKSTQEDMSLVSNNPNFAVSVSEPLSMTIFGLGLLGLATSRKGKKKSTGK